MKSTPYHRSKWQTDQYQTKIIVYNALNGTQIWESTPFSYTTALPPVYPVFNAYPADLIGTAENEWLINYSVKNPSNGAETGRVMVYRKDAGDVGFTQLLWETSYADGTVKPLTPTTIWREMAS